MFSSVKYAGWRPLHPWRYAATLQVKNMDT